MTIKNPTISAEKNSQSFTKDDIKISSSSINNYQTKNQNFDCKLPKMRQILTHLHKDVRYLWSNSVLANKLDLTKLIFSDESRFCLLNDGNMRWIKKGEKNDNIFFEKGKYNAGIMVYGQ